MTAGHTIAPTEFFYSFWPSQLLLANVEEHEDMQLRFSTRKRRLQVVPPVMRKGARPDAVHDAPDQFYHSCMAKRWHTPYASVCRYLPLPRRWQFIEDDSTESETVVAICQLLTMIGCDLVQSGEVPAGQVFSSCDGTHGTSKRINVAHWRVIEVADAAIQSSFPLSLNLTWEKCIGTPVFRDQATRDTVLSFPTRKLHDFFASIQPPGLPEKFDEPRHPQWVDGGRVWASETSTISYTIAGSEVVRVVSHHEPLAPLFEDLDFLSDESSRDTLSSV